MKRLMITFIFALTMILPVTAQEEDSARNIYYKGKQTVKGRPSPKGRIGTMVRIERKRGEAGPAGWVSSATSFRSGDWIRLHIRVNRPAYLTVFNQGTSGDLQLIYPKKAEDARSRISPTLDFTVPTNKSKWLEFDEVPGTERMVIMLSKAPLTEVLVALGGGSGRDGKINSESFRSQVEESTSRDFTEVEESTAEEDGQPAIFAVPSASNVALGKPIVYRLSLRHLK